MPTFEHGNHQFHPTGQQSQENCQTLVTGQGQVRRKTDEAAKGSHDWPLKLMSDNPSASHWSRQRTTWQWQPNTATVSSPKHQHFAISGSRNASMMNCLLQKPINMPSCHCTKRNNETTIDESNRHQARFAQAPSPKSNFRMLMAPALQLTPKMKSNWL